MPPDGYPALQYLQSVRVRRILTTRSRSKSRYSEFAIAHCARRSDTPTRFSGVVQFRAHHTQLRRDRSMLNLVQVACNLVRSVAIISTGEYSRVAPGISARATCI